MNDKINHDNSKIKQYEELFGWSIAVVAAVFALWSGKSKFQAMLSNIEKGPITFEVIFPFILFLLTIALGFSWFFSGKHEFRLLQVYLGKYAPEPSFTTLPLVIFVSAVIPLLACYSDKILIYSSLFLIYLSLAVYTGWLTSQHVLKAFLSGKNDPNIPQQYKDEVQKYYFRRPGPLLGYWTGTIVVMSFSCAIISKWIVTGERSKEFEKASYFLIIGAMILGEAVIWIWRIRLYRNTHLDKED